MQVCNLKDHLKGAKLYLSNALPAKDKDGVEWHWIHFTYNQYFVSKELWDRIMENDDVIGPIGGV